MASWRERLTGYGNKAITSVPNIMNSAVAAGAGGIGYYAAAKFAGSTPALSSRWWATPALMFAAGHVLKGKSGSAGAGLIGAAGALGTMAWLAQRAPAPQAQGYYGGYGNAGDLSTVYPDAGALIASDSSATSDIAGFGGDAGMLVPAGSRNQARGYEDSSISEAAGLYA